MDACVVFVSWPERPVAFSDVVDSLRCALHKRREALGVIEIDKRERFVRQHERGPAVDDVMDQHLALSQAIAERFDLIRRPQCEVVVSQPNTRALLYLL